jgi:PAS domain S-box-containing protein
VFLLGLLAAASGVFVLIGWALDNGTLKSVFPGLVTMKPNTALGMILCGGAMTLLALFTNVAKARRLASLLAVTAVALGMATLSQYFFKWDLGIDQMLFRDAQVSIGTSGPGRMAPATAFCFALAGGALAIAAQNLSARFRCPILLAIGTTLLVLGGTGWVGQMSTVLFHHYLWNFSGMALLTSLGFIMLGAGMLLLVRAEEGLTWVLDPVITGSLAGSAVIMLYVTGFSWNYAYELHETGSQLTRSSEALREIEKIRAGMANLESAQRGYIITGSEHLLDNRDQLVATVNADLAALQPLMANDATRQGRLEALRGKIAARTDFSDRSILLRRAQGFSAAQKLLSTGTGIALIGEIDRLLTDMRESEYAVLIQRQNQVDATAKSTFLLLPSGVFLTLAILSLATFFLNAGLAEEKQSRRMLHATEETSRRLAAIVDSSNDAIIGKDLNSLITSWNLGAERIFGYTAREMIGTPMLRLIPSDRRAEEKRIIERITRGEKVETFETVRRAKDGRLIDIAATVSPIRNHEGLITGASQVARDITEQKAAQAAVQESENQFRAMIDAIPQLACMADPDGSVFWYNQRWYDYTGTTLESMKGWGWRSVHDPEYLPRVMEEWSTAVATGEPFAMEFPIRAANGDFGWFLTRVVPVKDAAGHVVRWFGTNTDLSQQRETAEKILDLNVKLEQRVAERTAELEAANKELEAFSYSVSHDLRSPLRAIDGFSQAVVDECAHLLPERGQKDLQRIRAAAQRMGRLIDDLLAFSKLSRATFKKQQVHTSKLVRHVQEDLTRRSEHPTAEIRIGDLPDCHGDSALLHQVWVNLLSNALKYSSKIAKPLIEIGADEEQDETIYHVRDNGAGFDMRYAEKLFGVFQRLHRVDEFEGTGVGLAIVQRIVLRHGGRVWAEAKPNAGATFHFSLPKEQA